MLHTRNLFENYIYIWHNDAVAFGNLSKMILKQLIKIIL